MALTATATKETLRVVSERLSLTSPVIIGCPPNCTNITYILQQMPSVNEFCTLIASEMSCLRIEYPKSVIFCQRYSDVSAIYFSLRKQLKSHITFPPNYPIMNKFILVNMYTRASTNKNKEQILSSFCDPKGTLRLVIATSAFGLGVDCPDIRVVYHWGPPATIKEYIQETGRAGRDGLQSEAIMLYGNPGRFVLSLIREMRHLFSKVTQGKVI